jgi:hypothetical protein
MIVKVGRWVNSGVPIWVIGVFQKIGSCGGDDG